MTSRSATGMVFFTSAIILVIEIVAGRLMAPYVGVSLEAFTGIIGTVLAGIAAGSAVGGYLADRQNPRRLMAMALILGGVFTWLAIPIVSVLGPSMSGSPVDIVTLTFFGFFVPTALLSSISPVVAKLRLDSLDETGAVVGGLSAAGTVGALVGTFGTGFILLGLLPIRTIIVALGALLIVAGLVVMATSNDDTAKRPDASSMILIVAAGLATFGVSSPCDFETDYACARVVADDDRPGGRSLIIDSVRQAHVDLDDPTHLEIRYVKILGRAIDAQAAGPLDVLHVGGGGFSIPRYVSATRPGSTNVVLEIDEALVGIAEDHLGLDDADNLDIRIGDARLEFAGLATDTFDVIIGDAFGGDVVPWHLTTSEAVAEYDRMLRPGGLYAMNVIDGGESGFARAQMATLAEHFDHLAVVLPADPGRGPYNQILLASNQPLRAVSVAESIGVLLPAEAIAAYIGDAQVLTDEFAPAEQLKQRR